MTPNAMATLSGPIVDFFERLDAHDGPVPVEELRAALRDLKITASDIEPFIRYSDECYQRNRMHVGPGYHALALCWKPGQESPIHDHDGSACGVYVVQGTLREIKYKREADGSLSEVCDTILKAGDVCASYDADTHVIGCHDGETPLVTMHIYSPPLASCNIYHLDRPELDRWHDPYFEGGA